ncbi:RNB domain-containing ribonuclease [Actinokineospora sp. UTMC 2448]|uniref:RNB domain-containing ribonuclease n=1 Tax=Actinokineospora sp. UTMC 2448 TaxID=2268449 RepID=UPI0021642D54|nr:RNB domain-containing ribonuclease [Actinokineospora sp. UTMC 2448]UVS77243.1 Ribonuclease R [Actinokineospora sp. UTMC 2448]
MGRGDFSRVRAEFGLPDRFPDAVLAEAERAVDAGPRGERVDRTDIPLVTIDPPGAKDLDQAVHIERLGDSGFRVHYAIADLGAFVTPGGAVDTEVRRRGQTIYLPDGSVPMHPAVLSEGAASLLPGQVAPSALWTMDLDAAGEPLAVRVERALVRSTEQFDYASVQAAVDAGDPHPSVALLPALGELRRSAAIRRGALELQLPEQDVERVDGGWRLVLRGRTRVDAWNAEISLLTGMSAARMMLDAGIGLLRTLPDPTEEDRAWLRHSAGALGIDWPEEHSAAEVLARLDASSPAAMALSMDATRLLRGAGYTAFDGTAPELTSHAGIAAPYAHVTAPLRRLVDRFGTEVCLAVSADAEVPSWVREALPTLPALMEASDGLAARVDRACLDQVEAWVLADRVGEEFDAVVLRANGDSAEVFVPDPPVLGKAAATELPEGRMVPLRLVEADPAARRVRFAKG